MLQAQQRHRGRAFHLRQLDIAHAKEEADKRRALKRRVERRALEHRVMVEAIQLENELEASRCKLCDLLRAEAWGLGHTNWYTRRCGRCWVEQADALADQRHSTNTDAATRWPSDEASNRPKSVPPRAARRVTFADDANAGRRRDDRSQKAGPAAGGVAAAAVAAAAGGRSAVSEDADADAGSGLEGGSGGFGVEEIDGIMEALRARDADRLLQLMDVRALERHFGWTLTGGAAAGHGPPPQQGPADAVPPPDQPSPEGRYYHDVVFTALAAGQPQGAGTTHAPDAAQRSDGGLGGDVEDSAGEEEDAASSVIAEAGFAGSPAADRRGPLGHSQVTRARPPGSAARGFQPGDDGRAWHRYGPSSGKPAYEDEDMRGAAGRTGRAAAARSGAAGARDVDGARSNSAASEEQEQSRAASRTQEEGRAGRQRPARRARGGGGAVAGYRPEARPLPSKPRGVPSSEAEIQEALREAEQAVVFGRTQRQRTEALFYSHQLRAALADLRLLDRKAAKAEAVHRNWARLDTRDEEGVARIIREGRRERPPSPTTLRRILEPDTFYTDPPKRAPRWLEHIHPHPANPAKAVDVVPWKPPSARVAPPRHTEGLQSAGDWGEYRYDWDLAVIRSMRVNDYLSLVRKERDYREAWAAVKARANVTGPASARSVVAEVASPDV